MNQHPNPLLPLQPAVARNPTRRLLDEQNAANWSSIRAAAKGPPISDADLERLTADARARAATRELQPVGIASVMPAAARIVQGLQTAEKVNNPKIQKTDLREYSKRCHKIIYREFLSRARRFAKRRQDGDVREPTLYALAGRLVHYARIGAGIARVTYKALAFEVGVTRETIRKSLRYFERCKLIDTANVLVSVNGKLVREANAYFLRGPDAAEMALDQASASEQSVPQLGTLQRMAASAARIAQYFPRLVARPCGLNAIGLRLERPPPA